MSKRLFSILRIVTAAVVALVVAFSVNYGNWYLPVIFIVAAWIFMYALSKNVKEIIADERDYRIAGRAAGWAMRIYIMVSVIAGLVLYIAEKENEVLFAIGNVFLYSSCFLMIVYTVLYKVYERRSESD